MQIQFSEQFYSELKHNPNVFNAFCYNYFFNQSDISMTKLELERKLGDTDDFNLLKDLLKEQEIDYFIAFNGQNEVYNPNGLGNSIKPEDWKFKDDNGTLYVIANENAIGGAGRTIWTPSVLFIIV